MVLINSELKWQRKYIRTIRLSDPTAFKTEICDCSFIEVVSLFISHDLLTSIIYFCLCSTGETKYVNKLRELYTRVNLEVAH